MTRRVPLSSDDRAMLAGAKASRTLPEVRQARYVPERRALRLEMADGVALELPLDGMPECQALTDEQRAALQVGPGDWVRHAETDLDFHLSGWLASHASLVRVSQSITAWRQAVRYGQRRPFPVRPESASRVTWKRMSARFRRRVSGLLRDPQAGVALPPPAEGRVFTDESTGVKVVFRRDLEQVTILGVMTPRELQAFAKT